MAHNESALQRPHVLIVSDDPELSVFLGEGLVYAGFWTSTIASGIQTLEVFRLRTFDLVLIDAALGDLSAAEVVRRLRGRSDRVSGAFPRTDIPIVAIGASPEELDAAAFIPGDIDATFVAPIDLEEAAPRLHGIVQDWRQRHPGRPWADEAASRGPSAGM
jgi:two-component system response regulator ArlR